MAGIEMTHVPYRGVALALNDVIPGRVDVMFNTMAGVLQHARTGQLRGLAVTTAKRFPTAPEFPTVAESGVPGFDVVVLVRVLRARQDARPRSSERCTPTRWRCWPSPPSRTSSSSSASVSSARRRRSLARSCKAETEKWGPVIKAAGIKAKE